MRILSRSTLRDFWEQAEYQDAEQPLKAWFAEAKAAEWGTPQDVKDQYGNASIVANNRVVFNIHGNKYRLVLAIRYDVKICFIKFIGTHKQYDRIDVATI